MTVTTEALDFLLYFIFNDFRVKLSCVFSGYCTGRAGVESKKVVSASHPASKL